MTNTWMLILIAVVGGIAVALQGQFMSILTRTLGTRESVFITYGSGGLIIGLIMLAAAGGNLRAWRSVPPYTLTTGILGLIIVSSIGFVTSRLGLVATFTVIVASQFVLAALLDHFGWLGAPVRPLDVSRILGIVLLLAGVWLILRR